MAPEHEDPNEAADDSAEDAPAGGESQPAGPRIPPDDPADHESGKRFAVSDQWRDAPLVVTAEGGDVASDYAPAKLVARLAQLVHDLLHDLGQGVGPMLYAAVPDASMTLFFGDPQPEEAQVQLPVPVTLEHAKRVAGLIGSDGEALMTRALQMGTPVRRYTDLAAFVQNEGLTLRWTPHGEPPQKLSPERAARQHLTLTAEPPTRERTIVLHGVLYRVIAEPRDEWRGSIGIRLYPSSTQPPGHHGRRVLAPYESKEVEDTIKSEALINEPVEATVLVRQPILGTAIDAEHVQLVVAEIRRGPTESHWFGINLFDDDE